MSVLITTSSFQYLNMFSYSCKRDIRRRQGQLVFSYSSADFTRSFYMEKGVEEASFHHPLSRTNDATLRPTLSTCVHYLQLRATAWYTQLSAISCFPAQTRRSVSLSILSPLRDKMLFSCVCRRLFGYVFVIIRTCVPCQQC